jgi:transcriptional regulator of acetoin/glycerol metabolism
MDQLYEVVREAGYAVLLCDGSGVAVEHRGEDARESQFEYWGTWLGGVWSEEVEGTNGIGTCIVEERPVTVHRSQHFRSRHINLSCSGAPVFGVDRRKQCQTARTSDSTRSPFDRLEQSNKL